MDLFRRIFGKTTEDIPDDVVRPESQPSADAPPKEESSTLNEKESEGLDPSTRPVFQKIPTSADIADGVTQPLNQEVLIANHNSHISFGQSSDVGLVRNNNQDAMLSVFYTIGSIDELPDFGLFVVADGMGGHQMGEKASAIVTKTMAEYVTKNIYLPIINNKNGSDLLPISEVLIEGVQRSNERVIHEVPDGGTTVTAVAIVGDLAYVAHVGDSRAYLITTEGVEQLTRDHSLVQRLIELDQLTREEADDHPQRNVLYRALGQNESLEVDTFTRRLPKNSRLMICSDGLWGLVDEKNIYETAMNYPDPQQAADKLVALANTNGGVDNITVILLKVN